MENHQRETGFYGVWDSTPYTLNRVVVGPGQHQGRTRCPLPRPRKGSKKWNPKMNPVLHRGNWGIIRGFHFLDPLRALG